MPIALFALALAFGVMLLFGGMELDRALLLLVHSGPNPELTRAARWLTEMGGFRILIPATAIGSLILLLRRQWRSAIALVVITLAGRLFIEWLKIVTQRVRPEEQVHLVQVESLSFPSGHAGNATIVWLCLAFLLPQSLRGRIIAIWSAVWLALAIGLSRVMLGVHWPSDVIAGWALGLFWTIALLRLSGHDVTEGTRRLEAHSTTSEGE